MMTQSVDIAFVVAAAYGGVVLGAAGAESQRPLIVWLAIPVAGMIFADPSMTIGWICFALWLLLPMRRVLRGAWLAAASVAVGVGGLVTYAYGVVWIVPAGIPVLCLLAKGPLGRLSELSAVVLSVVIGVFWCVVLLVAVDSFLAAGMGYVIEDSAEAPPGLEIRENWDWKKIVHAYPSDTKRVSNDLLTKLLIPDVYGIGVSSYSVRVALRGGIQFLTMLLTCVGLVFVITRWARCVCLRDGRAGGPEERLLQDESEDGLVRLLITAIPSLGFLGTVLGIGQSMSSGFVGGGLSGMGGSDGALRSLGMAFNTTAVSLLCGLVLNIAVLWLDIARRRVLRRDLMLMQEDAH
jgi:hypothetical protein